MASNTLEELLKLPPDERVDLALALWESLAGADREAEFSLSAEQHTEFERRIGEHRADPGSSVPWEEVRRKLKDGA